MRWILRQVYQVDKSINRGILTGYNEAFVIDNDTKQALIRRDGRSEEIIRPLLRGRDIRRFVSRWAGLWLIDTHNGYRGVPAVDIDEYPAVKRHLDDHYPKLENRFDKGQTPYNLRNCAYHEEFEKKKLLWMDLTKWGRFAYDADGMFCLNTAFIMSGESIKYLCALLNSKLITWFMENTALSSGMGVTRWINSTVETIPIPEISSSKRRPFISLVDQILKAKAANQTAEISRLVAEIDQRTYELYRLTRSETRVVCQSILS